MPRATKASRTALPHSLPPCITKDQRRRLRKLAVRADPVWRADAEFFERRPDRMHRVRLADPDELAFQEILEGTEIETQSAGERYFVIVRLVVPGQRLRMFVMAQENTKTDMAEENARWCFLVFASPQVRKLEAAMRKGARLHS